MKIIVTQEHWNKAKSIPVDQRNGSNCVIALAIAPHVKNPFIGCTSFAYRWTPGKKQPVRIGTISDSLMKIAEWFDLYTGCPKFPIEGEFFRIPKKKQ